MNPILTRVIFWLVFNTILGCIISLLIYSAGAGSFWAYFWITQVNTHLISGVSATAGTWLWMRFSGRLLGRSLPRIILIVNMFTIPAALLAMLLPYFIFEIMGIEHSIQGGAGELISMVLVSVLLTVVISSCAVTLEYLLNKINPATQATQEVTVPAKAQKKPESPGLSFKEGPNHYFVPFEQILYLTADRNSTIVHTEERDYSAGNLLKEMSKKLPDNFMRVHKSHIVNLDIISHVQYLMGGAYMLYLKDEDESSLTVGRTYAARLKTAIGLGED